MADIFSKSKRSVIMSMIAGKDTKPEIIVRSFLFKEGFRFRKNVKDLPGRPDIVLPRYSTVIFIHGCFWHGHEDCRLFNLPRTNRKFWSDKISNNICRDARVKRKLRTLGWSVITVWECKLRNKKSLEYTKCRVLRLLNSI